MLKNSLVHHNVHSKSTDYLCVYVNNVYLCVLVICHSVVSDSCDPVDSSPPGFSIHRILQTRILEWVAFPSPGDLPDPRIKPRSPALQMDSLPSEPPIYVYIIIFTYVPQGHKILLDLQLVFRKYLNDRCNFIHKYHWHHCDVNDF